MVRLRTYSDTGRFSKFKYLPTVPDVVHGLFLPNRIEIERIFALKTDVSQISDCNFFGATRIPRTQWFLNISFINYENDIYIYQTLYNADLQNCQNRAWNLAINKSASYDTCALCLPRWVDVKLLFPPSISRYQDI